MAVLTWAVGLDVTFVEAASSSGYDPADDTMGGFRMNLFALAICVHAIIAILGLGQVLATALLATSMRREEPVAPTMWSALQRLVRGTSWAIGLMLLSGVLVEGASGGMYHETLWFRLAFFQTILLGALNGFGRRALRNVDPSTPAKPLRRVSLSAWIMCALIADITVLMELKPW
jgi:hypothetical protein